MARSGLWLERMHLKFHLLSLLLATNPTIILVPKELVAWWVKHHSLRLHVLFNRKNNNLLLAAGQINIQASIGFLVFFSSTLIFLLSNDWVWG